MKNQRNAFAIITACLLLLNSLAGCTKDEPERVYYTGPIMPAGEIGEPLETMPTTGYEIVETEPTVGRFPGALAVARLAPPGPYRINDDGHRTQWRICSMKDEEATYWNDLLTHFSSVREVVVLDAAIVTWPDADHQTINSQAKRLLADLLLIYGPTNAPEEYAAYGGVILDAHTAQPVAYLTAQAGPADYELPHTDTYEEDLRYRDPSYLAARRFELQAKRCIDELISRDTQPTTTQPSTWREHSIERKQHPLFILKEPKVSW